MTSDDELNLKFQLILNFNSYMWLVATVPDNLVSS